MPPWRWVVRNDADSAATRITPTHLILSLLAITGLALFILACRPSWSPDGEKVLYSYWDDGANKTAVAVFDRKTRTSRVMFEWWDENKNDTKIAGAQWTKDGQKAIVAIYEEHGVQLLALPVSAQKPIQAFTLEKMGESAFLPYPEVGRNLFLIAGDDLVRVNLENGEIFRVETKAKADSLLYDAGDKVFYLSQVMQKPAEEKQAREQSDSKKQNEMPSLWELGELDQRDLTFHPWLTLRQDELEAKNFGDFTGFLDVEPRTSRIVATEDSREGKPAKILVMGKNGIERVLDAGLPGKSYELGNPQWSRDGKTVYASVLIDVEKNNEKEFAVLEVPLDGKASRIDRILDGPGSEFDSDYLTYTQIALSPDGKLIAATNGHKKDTQPEKRGLYLLDVSRADRPVNFYPAPALPAVQRRNKE